jgi:nitroreductase
MPNSFPDALKLLATRRSIKPAELLSPGPSPSEIDRILTIASRVPDHGKLAPWRFIVIEGEARHIAGGKIAAVFTAKFPAAKPEHIDIERARFSRAPLVIAVVSCAAPHAKIPEWEQIMSAGAAAMNLLIAAHALGYAGSWITEWYAYDRAALDALGVAAHEKVAGFLHIGSAPGVPENRPRPSLADIVTRFGE